MSLKNIKIGPKLMAIVALLLVPLVVLSYLFITESLEDANFAAKERDGVAYQRGVWAALVAINASKADPSATPASRLSGQPDWTKLAATYDESLRTSAASQDLRQKLAAIGYPNQPVTDHEKAIEAMMSAADLMVKIADGSNITLDPDLDTYYLLASLTSHFPGVLEHLTSITNAARLDQSKAVMTADEIVDYAIEQSHYTVHTEGIESNAKAAVAGTKDAALEPALSTALSTAATLWKQYKAEAEAMRRAFADPTSRSQFDLAKLTDLERRSVAATDAVAQVMFDESDRLLQVRIDGTMSALYLKLAFAGGMTLLSLGLMLFVVRTITGSIGRLTSSVTAIAGDNLDVTVHDTDLGDEVGIMAKAVEVLRQNAIVARNAANENLRIKVALDNASTNMMVADTEGRIVYLNNAINGMMKQAESDLRKDLPNLVADKLVGASMDVFHKNPAHQRTMLERLTSTHRATVNVGGRIFNLTANPVMSAEGKRLGSVVEWDEVTLERRVEVEVDKVVTAAANGNFRERLSVEDKVGFMRNLAVSMNKLCETTANALDDVNNSLSSLANGDLTARITRDYDGMFDELKANLNQTAERLGQIVSEVVVGAGEVTSAASEITAGTNDLSSRTEQQASNLQETAASMEEIASTIKQNADNAQQANQLAINARTIASEGGQVAEKAVTAMSRIEASSQKMSDIIGVIDEIAFQTNLLALNAAVEAARAGDAGKGFAVVASEVRSLAQRSSEAAKEIKTLIQESDGQVKDGVRLVNEAGKSLGEIVGSVKKVTDIVSEIAAASREQATGVEEINKAVSQMDEMTQQNSALVEENAAACRMLQSQAENMTQRMAFFTLEEQAARPMARASGGGARPAAPAMKAPMAKAPMAKPAGRPAAPVGRQPAPPARKMGGGTAAQLQADLHSAFDDDPDWKEF